MSDWCIKSLCVVNLPAYLGKLNRRRWWPSAHEVVFPNNSADVVPQKNAFWFTTLKARRSRNVSHNCLWDRYWGRALSYRTIFPLSLIAIPKVLSKVNLAQKLTRFQITYHEQTNVQKCYTLVWSVSFLSLEKFLSLKIIMMQNTSIFYL